MIKHSFINDVIWDRKMPVNIKQICSGLNIKIHFVNMSSETTTISFINNGNKEILLNAKSSQINDKKIRFYLAHAISHHCLGHTELKTITDNKKSYLSENNCYYSADSNNFAINILIPDDAIKSMLFLKGIYNIKKLANELNVSEAAMYLKIKKLGYLNI